MTSGSDYLVFPLLAFGVVGILVLLLRWTFTSGKSLVRGPGKQGRHDEYGLLVAVASPATYIEGEVARRTLEAAGIRANLAQTLDGPTVMVFPEDAPHARAILTDLGTG